MWRIVALVLFVFVSGGALAQSGSDVELRRLTTLLDAIRQEQQSVYQQFQMTEALQRSEIKGAESASPAMEIQEGQAPSYDDAVRAKQERQTRLKYYADEMRHLSDRYRELGTQGTELMEEMRGLAKPAR
jgi:hypothetical protein